MVLAICALSAAWGQDARYRPSPRYVAGSKPDQAEGARVLGEFQQVGIAGSYWLAFELRVMPRKGAERIVKGDMLGTGSNDGPVSRLAIGGQQWLIMGGRHASTWRRQGDATPEALSAAQTLEPVADTDLSVFDLQMPFLHWTDFVYEGLANVRSRPAHSFVLYPPADLAASRPGLSGVRVMLDAQFHALVQAEMLGAKGEVEKTIGILDLKKVDQQWIPKSIDVRNHLTRDKTRFQVTAVALALDLPAGLFSPEGLSGDSPSIPNNKIVHF